MILEARKPTHFEDALLGLSALASVALLAWIWAWAGYGFDLTDEGAYLNWMLRPAFYPNTVHRFAYLLRPFFELLNGDIVSLRRLDLLATFAGTWALALAALRVGGLGRLASWRGPALAAALAAPCLLVFSIWLTPNYNTLLFQALCLAAMGSLLALDASETVRLGGWALVCAGGVLTFLVKAPSAALLAMGVLVLTGVLAAPSRRALAWVIIASGLLLWLAAWWMDGSLMGFIRHSQKGLAHITSLAGGHGLRYMFRIDRFTLRPAEKGVLALALFAAAGAASLIASPWTRMARAALGVLGALPFLLLYRWWDGQGSLPFNDYQLSIFLALPLASLSFLGLGGWQRLKQVGGRSWGIAAFLVLMPYVLTFGSARNYWINMAWGGVFWSLAGAVLVMDLGRTALLLPFAAMGQALTVLLLAVTLENPIRQPQPLRLNTSPLVLGGRGSALVLPASYETYFTDLRDGLKRAGYRAGDPVIDLSGHSMGILFAVEALPMGSPYLPGDLPGSDAFAVFALRNMSCQDLARSWVLTEPEGPRHLGPQVLSDLGLDLKRDYRKRFELMTPPGSRGYSPAYRQEFWRPSDDPSKAEAHCAGARL